MKAPMLTLSVNRRSWLIVTLITMLVLSVVVYPAQAEEYATPVAEAPAADVPVDTANEDTAGTPTEVPADGTSEDTSTDDESEESAATPTDVPEDQSGIATPTEAPVDESSIATPTADASNQSSPVPVPASISWSQPAPITCTLQSGHPNALNLNETATYRCTAAAMTEIAGDLLADTGVTWTLQAAYSGDAVSFSLPLDSAAEVLPPDDMPDGIDARLRLHLPLASTAEQNVTFDVIVTRTSCTVGESTLTLTAEPTFAGEGVGVTRTDMPSEEPFTLTATAAPNGQPEIGFAGPITFEALSVSSRGLSSQVSSGTGTIIVAGSWNPCTDYTLYLSGSMQLPESTSATLRVVAVDNEPIPGGACDLTTGCALAALPASGDAAAPLQFTVQLEVEFDTFALPGDYGMTVTAGTEAVQAQP